MNQALPRAVLWDMDGVLVDTGDLHYQSWTDALSRRGIELTDETFRLTFGMNNTGILRLLLGPDVDPALVETISAEKEFCFRKIIPGKIVALPGALMWLERLQVQGYRQSVASSGPLENIAVIVDALGIRSRFDALTSGFSISGKPDPSVFLEAARRLEVPPSRCIVVEDAIAGLQAAQSAGMRCIAVTTTNPPEALRGADIVIDRLDHLPEDVFERLTSLF
jgi:beta-phosphoglucomutase-like phosphatase (HAD superfamily)